MYAAMTTVPSTGKPPPAADGQMGSVVRAYREWLLGGDRAWLTEVWPGIRRAFVFASANWDSDGDGVFDGQQHNTYDIEFYGPNPLCSVYYLAALRAAEELALVVGEADFARRCRDLPLCRRGLRPVAKVAPADHGWRDARRRSDRRARRLR